MPYPVMAVCLLAGCITPTPVSKNHGETATAHARINGSAQLIDLVVTPVELLEDSRCPINARCIRAGELKINARVELYDANETHELTLGQPRPVGYGFLELTDASPAPVAGPPVASDAYEFTFRYVIPDRPHWNDGGE